MKKSFTFCDSRKAGIRLEIEIERERPVWTRLNWTPPTTATGA